MSFPISPIHHNSKTEGKPSLEPFNEEGKLKKKVKTKKTHLVVNKAFQTTKDSKVNPSTPSKLSSGIGKYFHVQNKRQTVENELDTINLNESNNQEPNLDLDFELTKIINFIKKLHGKYEQRKQFFESFAALSGTFFKPLEYTTANKDNIAKLVQCFDQDHNSDKAESYLENLEDGYKWTNSGVPFLASLSHYWIITDIQANLKKHEQEYDRFKAKAQKDASYSEKIDEIKKLIQGFKLELESDREKSYNKAQNKLEGLSSRASSILLQKKFTQKTANRLSKCSMSIFKSFYALIETKNECSIQKEWLYRLQPRINVNICAKKPKRSQKKFLAERKAANQILREEVNDFFSILEMCENIEEVHAQYKKIGVAPEITPTIEDFRNQWNNRRFRRDLVQSYYYQAGQKHALMDNSKITSILEKKKEEHERKIVEFLPTLGDHIQKCVNMSFDEIKTYFQQLHISIDSIDIPDPNNVFLPPTTKAEWDNCVQNKDFCTALAEKWVEFQETKAQLSTQGIRQALLSKHSVERKFLFFRIFQYTIAIISASAQILICLPVVKLFALSSAVEFFVTDLSKLGIPGAGIFYLFYPLYPEINFKVEGICMPLIEHVYCSQYKPNIYTMEGYKLNLQIHRIESILFFHSLSFFLKQILLWLNIQLVEHCIMRLQNKPMVEDERYIQMDQEHENYHLDCKLEIKKLEQSLKALRLKDAQLAFPSIPSSTESEDSNEEDLNPFYNLAQELQGTNIDYFPSQIKEFWEDHLGITLTNASKNRLQKDLEEFFSLNEKGFIQFYQSNRFSYVAE